MSQMSADLKSMEEDKNRVFAKLADEMKAKEDLLGKPFCSTTVQTGFKIHETIHLIYYFVDLKVLIGCRKTM